MADTGVVFAAGGIGLAGTLRVPAGLAPGERRPGFVVLHGFGTNMNAPNVVQPCDLLESLGYATLRFDMRGCGASGGNRGRLNCDEQVEDTCAAVGFLADHPQIHPDRIGVIGNSYGGAIAIASAGADPRIAAAISSSGWGNGERKFRRQHALPEAWARFEAMLEEGRRRRRDTGEDLMVDRFDIVPIPPRMRTGLARDAVMSFTADTAQSIFDFRPEAMIAAIAPRPVLLLHSSVDSVTPSEESVEMFRRAGAPTELHLFADTDHFMLAEGNPRVRETLTAWLAKYFPVN